MKKMKLFPKIFFYTFSVMLFITITAHLFLYLFAPRMFLGTHSIQENGIIISGSLNTETLIESAILKALPLSSAFCIITALLASLLFSKFITTPIKEISKSTQLMAKFDKAVRCPVDSCDEIGVLAGNVNTLFSDFISAIENLENEKKKVWQAEQSKIEFLRAASHELKTPVTALYAVLDNMILGVGKYQDKDAGLIQCREMTARLSDMIRNILDTSRMDFISESKNGESFHLKDVLPDLCQPFLLIAKSRGIDFQIKIFSDCRLYLSKKSLEKILSNLLSNAVLYTKKEGCITVVLKKDILIVENECTPIPEAKLAHIFEPFYRTDFARDRNSGGNGLGLYIVHVLAKAMGLSYSFKAVNEPSGMRFTLYF